MQSSPATVFVDTSAWKAFYDEEDDRHREARDFMDSIVSKKLAVRLLVTSDYVMDETLTLVKSAHSHSKAVELSSTILSSRATKLVFVSEELFSKALGMFVERKDKEWSFTDCSSFILMKHLSLTSAFAFDPHFQQAGFHILP